ncbi:MAG TPA: PfkB family carbohydrate kinase [Fimbriimonadaceae bacterium]|nr:PfkB family carbohydrate kinase [Fimbriimonadaceae bacterium]
MTSGFDVLGIGVVSIDDLLYVDAFPAPDEKVPVRRTERHCGGLTGTALVAAAKLGARCGFGGLLGFDELSATVEAALARHGIDLGPAIRRDDARPVHAVIVVGEAGNTRNIFFNVTAPVGSDVAGPSEDVIRATKVLFIDSVGVDGALRATKIARAAGAAVVADFEHDEHPRFEELMALVDHLVLSEGFARRVTGASSGRDAVPKLWNENRKAVVVTGGVQGAWFTADGMDVEAQAAFPVSVVDTTGCGDVFHGAYAAALAAGQPLVERVRFAAAAAALKATQRGGQAGAPTLAQVRDLLDRTVI